MKLQLPVLEPESCEGCGLCCCGSGSPVLLYASRPGERGTHPFRPSGLPPELIDEIDAQFCGLRRGDEPQDTCFWYDVEACRCRHYEWRPAVCRDFEFGGAACLNLRRPHVIPGDVA